MCHYRCIKKKNKKKTLLRVGTIYTIYTSFTLLHPPHCTKCSFQLNLSFAKCTFNVWGGEKNKHSDARFKLSNVFPLSMTVSHSRVLTLRE